MRTITEHEVNECNRNISIKVLDEPGSGGACHEYRLSVRNIGAEECFDVKFQNGPIKEVGANGLTHEALMAVLLDRMRAFQNGPYRCRENAVALTKMEEALMWLNKRTANREARGVEGTHEQ